MNKSIRVLSYLLLILALSSNIFPAEFKNFFALSNTFNFAKVEKTLSIVSHEGDYKRQQISSRDITFTRSFALLSSIEFGGHSSYKNGLGAKYNIGVTGGHLISGQPPASSVKMSCTSCSSSQLAEATALETKFQQDQLDTRISAYDMRFMQVYFGFLATYAFKRFYGGGGFTLGSYYGSEINDTSDRQLSVYIDAVTIAAGYTLPFDLNFEIQASFRPVHLAPFAPSNDKLSSGILPGFTIKIAYYL